MATDLPNSHDRGHGSPLFAGTTRADNALPHHAGDAARLVSRQRHAILEKAARGVPAVISRTRIGPGAAARIGLAGSAAGPSDRIGRDLEIAIVAAGTIEADLGARRSGEGEQQ